MTHYREACDGCDPCARPVFFDELKLNTCIEILSILGLRPSALFFTTEFQDRFKVSPPPSSPGSAWLPPRLLCRRQLQANNGARAQDLECNQSDCPMLWPMGAAQRVRACVGQWGGDAV